ncbi:MAG: sporulation-specific N-acetylmuramoyl-L-alanine amidase [Clostridia bacterium]|jgi:N-acetylmuramoyl-L-alanine amidase|nr:sporulation-specific N-acetylmuramoyl-L-alanine amidase [Clostridia bacterium]
MSKVLIDIGHGGSDPGAQANGLVEKVINLKVGLLLKDYLLGFECDVKLTRETDITLTADQRVAIAKAYNPDLCISVHHNAAEDIKARGSEVIHAHYDDYDDKLALDIMQRLAVAGMPKRRAFTKLNSIGSDWYYMIRRIWDNDTDAIITEGGFVTNAADAALLKTDAFLTVEAQAIAYSIVDYLKLRLKKLTEEQQLYIAIAKLKDRGIMNSPAHWLENAKAGKLIRGEFASQLIIKFAKELE